MSFGTNDLALIAIAVGVWLIFLFGINTVGQMPFRKVGPNSFVSPSGRKYTKKQVAAYYATGGFKRKPRKRRKKKR